MRFDMVLTSPHRHLANREDSSLKSLKHPTTLLPEKMPAILLYVCFYSSVSALKLHQEPPQTPEFDTSDATYAEDCGDRNNYKCWKKGGHSLDKCSDACNCKCTEEMAAILTTTDYFKIVGGTFLSKAATPAAGAAGCSHGGFWSGIGQARCAYVCHTTATCVAALHAGGTRTNIDSQSFVDEDCVLLSALPTSVEQVADANAAGAQNGEYLTCK